MRVHWLIVDSITVGVAFWTSVARICIDAVRSFLGRSSLPRITPRRLTTEGGMRQLSVLLRRRVVGVHFAPASHIVGDAATGTDRVWCVVQFEEGEAEAMFFKMPSSKIWLRAFLTTVTGLYANEMHFYSSIAPMLPSSILPRVHAAKKDGTRFVLVLEDLIADANTKLYNLSDNFAEMAPIRAILESLADVHATFMENPYKVWDESMRPPFYRLIMEAVLCNLKLSHPESLPPRAEALFRRFVENYDIVRSAWSEGVQCFVHGDAHLGNIFTRTEPSGKIKAGLYDWQVRRRGTVDGFTGRVG